ncbi:hypothetical protein CVT24_008307 [Panaeolus cyanescens]|uniref:Adhesin domain-containing protein n=1 Tax=Panaeolus cyanescens TaxID=181874 RepID=A0A409YLT6_9AGAR|nr:hypothetical protein CVT24_008307 [Panaeolus cyanescens]
MFVVLLYGLFYVQDGMPWNPKELKYPTPNGVSLLGCITPSDWIDLSEKADDSGMHSSEVVYDIPLSDISLVLLSKGTMADGDLSITVNPDLPGDRVDVRVMAAYSHRWARDLGKVCRVSQLRESREGGSGIGIFTPLLEKPAPSKAVLRYKTVVMLPLSALTGAMTGLDIDMDNTRLQFGNISTHPFRNVDLRTTNRDMDIKSVIGESVYITTSHVDIKGKFQVSDSLSINSAVSGIDIEVIASGSPFRQPRITLSTSDRPLIANLSLTSESTTETGGMFDVAVSAMNGPLDIKFATQPLDSKLKLAASSTNYRPSVLLNTAYEGSFDVYGHNPTLRCDSTIADPTGRNRPRICWSTSGSHDLSGFTYWEKEHERSGRITFSAMNTSGVELAFGLFLPYCIGMILTEDLRVDDERKPAGISGLVRDTSSHNAECQPLLNDSPPPYGSTSSSAYFQPPNIHHTSNINTRSQGQGKDFHRNWQRDCPIIVIMLLMFVGLLCGSFYVQDGMLWNPKELKYPTPDHISLLGCIAPGDWIDLYESADNNGMHSSEVVYNIPLSDVSLILLSKGTMSDGDLSVIVNPDLPEDRVIVRVTVVYRDTRTRDLGRVCRVTQVFDSEQGGSGIGIFTPLLEKPPPPKAVLRYKTVVTLPISAPKGPTTSLDIDMDHTSLQFGNLSAHPFETVDLRTTDRDMDVKSVIADLIFITTSRVDIRGKFEVAYSLSINSAVSGIDVEVIASGSPLRNSRITLSTSDRPLFANLSLTSATETGGMFDVGVSAMNAPLDIKFGTQPFDSKLKFAASSTNYRSSVLLNTAYEGSFDVYGYNATLISDWPIPDPTGRNRNRTCWAEGSSDDLSGAVFWEQGHLHYGRVVITATNANSVELAFGP